MVCLGIGIKRASSHRAINNEPDYAKAANYWRWLKRKLKQAGVQLVSGTHGFKFEAPDGKRRVAEGVHICQCAPFTKRTESYSCLS